MKIITKNTDYAVRALCRLSKEKKFISTTTISKEEKIPVFFLRKILNILIKSKIVESKEGKNGGVRLIKKPDSIKLIDIIKLFQGEISISQCILRKNLCPFRERCPLRKKLEEIEKTLKKEFEVLTIKSLIEKKEAE